METAKYATSFPFHLVNKCSSKICGTALRDVLDKSALYSKAAYDLLCPATEQIWCGGMRPHHNLLIAVPANGTSFTQLGEWCIVCRQMSCFCLSLPDQKWFICRIILVTYTLWQNAVYYFGAKLSIASRTFWLFGGVHSTLTSGRPFLTEAIQVFFNVIHLT